MGAMKTAISLKKMGLRLALLLGLFGIICTLPVAGLADGRVEKNISKQSAYVFRTQDVTEYFRPCDSLSGQRVLCETQRTITSDPVYFGLGLNLGVYEKVNFGIEADWVSPMKSSKALVPQWESDRGMSFKGRLQLDLL